MFRFRGANLLEFVFMPNYNLEMLRKNLVIEILRES